MDQALDASAYIYQGFWRNLSKDVSRSLTLTLCPTYSVILTNALTLFVAMAGGQLWTIIRFTLHQIRATVKPETMSRTYNQQQVVLRNATTDIAAARLMLYLAWTCRKNARGAILTCLTIFALAIFNAGFFMVAGTFSNSLVNAGSSVLSRSPFCGMWNETYLGIAGFGNNAGSLENLALSTEFLAADASEVQLNLEYVQNCYKDQPSSYWDSTCGGFEKPKLNWTTHFDGPCPFAEQACSRDAAVITFDTGKIDSHLDLGINAGSKDRLQYRRVTQCTVLNDTNFITTSSQSNIAGTDLEFKVAYANYGASLMYGTNFTYSYSNFADFYTNFSGLSTTPFQVATTFSYGESGVPADLQSPSQFEPIDELYVKDADIGLFFLSYTGRYTQPIDDPWFSAHRVYEDPETAEILQTLYKPDRLINTVACTQQHQFCSSPSSCTPLQGMDQVQQTLANNFVLTPSQNVTLDRVVRASIRASLLNVVQQIAKTSSPVLAINNSATASFTVSMPLPNHQWQLELNRWHSIAMARIQRTVVEYGTGQVAAQTKYLLPPQTSSEKWLCQNQRIHSAVYQSFNVVSLIVIVIFGVLIIVTSLRIESFAGWVQERWHVGGRARDMWNDHDMLGKQRWRAMFATPQSSMYGVSPSVQLRSPFPHTSMHLSSPQRNMELAYLQTNFPGFGTHHPMNPSPRRASSQALSPGDSARTFQHVSEKQAPPQAASSPCPSSITADFIFDFGPPRNPPSPHCNGYPLEKKAEVKPLPQMPVDEKAFVIDRGLETTSGADIADEKRSNEIAGQEAPEAEPAVGSGPGRWAYYSAHKRRYGPRLAVPAPHVLSSPHVMTSNNGGLRGSFGPDREGNWI